MIDLPEKQIKPGEYTYDVPHILLSVEGSVKQVREGGLQQANFETEIEYSFNKPEPEQPFTITVSRQINFAGNTINVLTDGFDAVSPSTPTAKEYMDKSGQRVLHGFTVGIDSNLTKINNKTVYKIGRSYVFLP